MHALLYRLRRTNIFTQLAARTEELIDPDSITCFFQAGTAKFQTDITFLARFRFHR